MTNWKVLWDFDGVILDSNSIRGDGFRHVLSAYPTEEVATLLKFHEVNGGLSRYVKFRHFFEKRGESLSDDRLAELVEAFSDYMRQRLTNPDFLIQPTIAYLEAYSERLPMYIVSGSDQTELRYLNEQLGLAHYFRGIYGSPTPKIELVRRIIANNNYPPDECVLIGDSINDYEAADKNNIAFIGYNNPEIERQSTIALTDVFPPFAR